MAEGTPASRKTGPGRWIRRALIAIAVLVLVVFVAIAVALTMIDTRMVQDRIAEEVEQATGRTLHFEGDLSLSFFPWLGFSLGATELSNAEGFDDAPFARIEQTQLRVQVLPLLRREVALDTIVLDGLALNLAINEAGRSNWADLEEAFADEADEVEEAVDPGVTAERDPDAEGLDLPFDLRVNGLAFRNASATWRDETTNLTARVRDLNLTTGPLVLGEETPVRFSVQVEVDDAPTLNLEARTRATVTLEPMAARLQETVVTLQASGADLPEPGVRASLRADIDVDLDSGTAVVAPLQLRALDVVEVNGRTEVDFSNEEPAFAGRIQVEPFNLRDLLTALGEEAPETEDPSALSAIGLGFYFAGTPSEVNLRELRLQLDDTRMEGEVQAVIADIPQIRTRLHIDEIDLDRYLPPVDEAAEAAAAANGNGNGEPQTGPDPIEALPLELLRELDADVGIRIDRIGYSGLDARDTEIDVILVGGILTLEQFRTHVAEGTIQAGARLDASGSTPAVRFNTELAGVQAGPISDALMESVPVMGRLDSNVAIHTRGDTLDEWIRRLNGRVNAEFTDGGVRGFNLARELRVATARFQGREEPGAADERQTDFSSLRYGARIENGIIHTELLDLRAPLLRVTGEGRIDLPRERLDHTVRVLVTDALEGQEGREFQELRGLTVPIRITGTFTDPSIRILIDDAFADRIRQEAEAAREALRQEQEQLEQRLRQERREAERRAREELERQRREAEEEAKDRLRGIFGN